MTETRKSTERDIQSLHPVDLFDREKADEDQKWWAIYTLARQEKSLARDLYSFGVSYFLPLVESTKVYRRNRVTRHLPLFPGYLFLNGSEEDRVRSLTTNRVSRILEASEPRQMLADLSQIYRLIQAGVPLTAENRLAAGDRVRIKTGPLAGVEGVVIRRRTETRLLVSVHFLQQGASVAVDDFMLEPIGPNR